MTRSGRSDPIVYTLPATCPVVMSLDSRQIWDLPLHRGAGKVRLWWASVTAELCILLDTRISRMG